MINSQNPSPSNNFTTFHYPLCPKVISTCRISTAQFFPTPTALEQGAFSREVRLLPSRRNWEIEVLSFWVTAFQRDGSPVPEKEVLGCKTGERLLKRFTPQRPQRKDLQWQASYSKCSKRREVRGPESGRSLSKMESSCGACEGASCLVACFKQFLG